MNKLPYYRNHWVEETMCAEIMFVAGSSRARSCYRAATHAVNLVAVNKRKRICKMHASWVKRTNTFEGARMSDNWAVLVSLETK
jgi:hypothetical protein